jgi:hypothetical protein
MIKVCSLLGKAKQLAGSTWSVRGQRVLSQLSLQQAF